MGRWLSRVHPVPAPVADHEKTPQALDTYPTQPTKAPCVGCVGKPTSAFPEKIQLANPQEMEMILVGLAAAGRRLGTVEQVARWTMQALSREAAAELAVALDDAFEMATDDRGARAQCRRLLNDPRALAAAKAVWPDLPPPPPDAPTPAAHKARPVADHFPRWLRLIRKRCPLLPEDENHIRRHLGRLM